MEEDDYNFCICLIGIPLFLFFCCCCAWCIWPIYFFIFNYPEVHARNTFLETVCTVEKVSDGRFTCCERSCPNYCNTCPSNLELCSYYSSQTGLSPGFKRQCCSPSQCCRTCYNKCRSCNDNGSNCRTYDCNPYCCQRANLECTYSCSNCYTPTISISYPVKIQNGERIEKKDLKKECKKDVKCKDEYTNTFPVGKSFACFYDPNNTKDVRGDLSFSFIKWAILVLLSIVPGCGLLICTLLIFIFFIVLFITLCVALCGAIIIFCSSCLKHAKQSYDDHKEENEEFLRDQEKARLKDRMERISELKSQEEERKKRHEEERKAFEEEQRKQREEYEKQMKETFENYGNSQPPPYPFPPYGSYPTPTYEGVGPVGPVGEGGEVPHGVLPQYHPQNYGNYYPPQGYPPQEYPPQEYPPQEYPPQDYPPQDYPPNYAPEVKNDQSNDELKITLPPSQDEEKEKE